MRNNSLLDALFTYAFLVTYLLFNILYTLVIPNASNNDGEHFVYGITDWRGHPVRSLFVAVVTAVVMVPVRILFPKSQHCLPIHD